MVNPQLQWQDKKNEETIAPEVEKQKKPTYQVSEQAKKIMWGPQKTENTVSAPVDPTADESSMGWLVRNASQIGSRLFEQVVGAPGNIYQAAEKTLKKNPWAAGALGVYIHDYLGEEAWNNLVEGPIPFRKRAPTSEQIREGLKQVTSEYTEPKTGKEKKVSEFVEDVGSTLITRRPATARNVLINNLGIPAAANAVKQTIEDLGFGEDRAMQAKFGVWTGLSLLGNVNGRAHATNMVREGRNAMPPYMIANVPRYEASLATLDRRFLAGDPRSALARQQLDAVRQDIANGQTSIRDLMNRYDAINAVKQDRGLFDLDHNTRQVAIRNIDSVRNAVRDEIRALSQRTRPEALEQWQSGMQQLAVINQSQRMTGFIHRTLTGPYSKLVSPIVLALFGGSGYMHPMMTAGATAAAPIVYKGAQIAQRVWSNPELARYYWQAVSAAQAENATAFINNYKKLDSAYRKKYGSGFEATEDKKSKP